VSDIKNPLKTGLGTGVEYLHVGLYDKIVSRIQRLESIRGKIESGDLVVS